VNPAKLTEYRLRPIHPASITEVTSGVSNWIPKATVSIHVLQIVIPSEAEGPAVFWYWHETGRPILVLSEVKEVRVG
jgi:hypothetical protein